MELIVGRFHVETVKMAIVAVVLLLAPSFTTINAYDPSPLQNVCVADNNASVHVNGKVCKDPKLVTVDDFVFSGLQIPPNTNNSLGIGSTPVSVNNLPGLNTLGITIVRTDFAPNGVAPPLMDPRATELTIVLEGSLYVGFVDSTPGTKSKLFSTVLKAGDVFVFPFGLIKIARNVGNTTAVVLSAVNNQYFGESGIPTDVFGADPPIPADLLAKAFQLDNKTIQHLQSVL